MCVYTFMDGFHFHSTQRGREEKEKKQKKKHLDMHACMQMYT